MKARSAKSPVKGLRDFRLFVLIIALFVAPVFIVFPQDYAFESDDFGFGDTGAESSSGFAFKFSGELSAKLLFFLEGFKSSELGNIVSGKFDFSASGKIVDGLISFSLHPDFSDFSADSLLSLNEAYLRFYAGPVDIEAGLRKLTWGRADSFGPLDVINPVDYSDLSAVGNPRDIKIARPMIHVNWNIGAFSKLEGVFVPWFAGHTFASTGRWAPAQMSALPDQVRLSIIDRVSGLYSGVVLNLVINAINAGFDSYEYNPENLYPKTNTLQYAQGGLRFSTTLGGADLGAQYYYGRLPRPAFAVDINDFIDALSPPVPLPIPGMEDIHFNIDFNPFHHIGIDYAQVLGGFNIRAEAGVNITNDIKGSNGAVYNPHMVWSLGFDRDLVWGINLNLQANGLIRLMYKNIGSDPLAETEAGAKLSSTRITAIISKKFLQDKLEVRAAALWGIEDRDFLITPGVSFTINDITAELSAGIFGGNRAGELGQYRGNSYIKAAVTWSF